jgi:hypothetical protein
VSLFALKQNEIGSKIKQKEMLKSGLFCYDKQNDTVWQAFLSCEVKRKLNKLFSASSVCLCATSLCFI